MKICSGLWRSPLLHYPGSFSPRHSQIAPLALSAASQLTLLMKWRSLSGHKKWKIHASMIFHFLCPLAELCTAKSTLPRLDSSHSFSYNPEFDTCEIKKWLQTQ